MRFFRKLLPLVAIVIVMTGCMGVGDDTSNCVYDENASLVFKYTDSSGTDAFPQNVNSVDAFIFDKDQKFVTKKRFDRAALDVFRGWKLTLPEGDYYAVCWANMDVNSKFNDFTPGLTTLDQCMIQINPDTPGAGDQIFYAPAKKHPHSRASNKFSGEIETRASVADLKDHAFTLVKGQNVVKELVFIRSHLTVNVLISGVSTDTEVIGTQLWSEYDFLFSTKSLRRDYVQQCNTTTYENKPALISTFFSGFGEITENINFIVKRVSDNNILETVNLKQFLTDNPTAYNTQTNTIDMLIAFSDLGVTVSVPDWDEKPVTPGND